MADADRMSHVEAASVIKRAAEEQKIAIELTEEQMEALLAQWSGDPQRPAQITFRLRNRAHIELPVASCAYWGSTCCAFGIPDDQGDPPLDRARS